jgi:hypothetical protein
MPSFSDVLVDVEAADQEEDLPQRAMRADIATPGRRSGERRGGVV